MPTNEKLKEEILSTQLSLTLCSEDLRKARQKVASLEEQFHSLQRNLHNLQREELYAKAEEKKPKKISRARLLEEIQKAYNLTASEAEFVVVNINFKGLAK